jgi:hypothetical protein
MVILHSYVNVYQRVYSMIFLDLLPQITQMYRWLGKWMTWDLTTKELQSLG